MNRIQRSEYSEKNTRRLKRFEREYLPAMYRLISRQFKRAAANVRQGKPATDQLAWDTDIQAEITNLYNTVGVFYTAKTIREINVSSREQKAFGLDPEWIARIQEYFRLNLLNKAVLPISQTTRDEILRILTQGEQEGWGIDRMAFELENSTLPLYRARMIVRTELLKAQHYGKELGAEESDFETVKQWIAAKDHRTRHSHRLVDGELVDVNGRFRVGKKKGGFDLMAGPGDPEASAENVINCRCTVAVVAKRDEEGRLIRKRKISVLLPSDINRQRQVVTI